MIHVPPLQPDEIAWGFLCRVRALNEPSHEVQNGIPMPEWIRRARQAHDVETDVQLVAKLTKTSPRHVEFRHTLAPFWGIARAGRSREDTGGGRQRHRPRNSFPCSACFCPKCLGEDRNYWGFSYWRRSHQIPGIMWCPKHRSPLRWLHQAGGMRYLPHAAHCTLPASVDADAAFHALRTPTIQRYGKICHAFLDREQPFSVEQLTRCMQRKAKHLGVRTSWEGQRGDGPFLSDLALTFVAGPWLQRYFREVAEKQPGACISSFDNAITSLSLTRPSTSTYALALALLYDSADTAMGDLASTMVPAGPHINRELDGQRERARFAASGKPSAMDAEATTGVQAALSAFAAGSSIQVACQSAGVASLILETILRSLLAEQRVYESSMSLR